MTIWHYGRPICPVIMRMLIMTFKMLMMIQSDFRLPDLCLTKSEWTYKPNTFCLSSLFFLFMFQKQNSSGVLSFRNCKLRFQSIYPCLWESRSFENPTISLQWEIRWRINVTSQKNLLVISHFFSFRFISNDTHTFLGFFLSMITCFMWVCVNNIVLSLSLYIYYKYASSTFNLNKTSREEISID